MNFIKFPVGNKHVSEIASMALDLLCASIVFKIPHMPNARLQLRMGIHTGSAIGIVSGSKTPKYLLVLIEPLIYVHRLNIIIEELLCKRLLILLVSLNLARLDLPPTLLV